jgi:hypothetical protein
MLPVYKASAFQKFALEGGSSLPCIVSVEDDYGRLLNDDYVVKIFKQDKSNHTCKEVFAAILAQHFELKTPKPVLIEVNNALLNVLKKQEKYKNWQVTEGVFFGNQYLKNAKSFINTPDLDAYDIWEITNLFAFDVLILNTDRQLGKPNVLTKNQDIYVIDHELSMNISKPFDTYVNQNQWDYFIKDKRGGHLFRQYLCQVGQKKKVTFDDFFENLRTLKPKILYNYAEQLAEYDYAPLDIPHIVAYLEDVKKNESKFIELLNKLLN